MVICFFQVNHWQFCDERSKGEESGATIEQCSLVSRNLGYGQVILLRIQGRLVLLIYIIIFVV